MVPENEADPLAFGDQDDDQEAPPEVHDAFLEGVYDDIEPVSAGVFPETDADCLSRMFFCWMCPLLCKGYKVRQLTNAIHNTVRLLLLRCMKMHLSNAFLFCDV